jgi:hypothetical protein
VVASGPTLFTATAWAWPNATRKLLATGLNGADLALVRILATESVERRFDQVVVVSGDAIFASEVARLGHAGVKTTVLSRASALSRRLRLAATDALALPESLAYEAVVA